MKLVLLALLSLPLFGQQASFTQGTAPTAAKPSVLSIPMGTGTACTITGNTFPATTLTFSGCNAGGVTLPSFTIPNTLTLPWALTIQVNSGTNASAFILQITAASPFTVQATVNGAAAVGGTF